MTENTTITRAELARMIDHTLLEPEATDDDVARLAKEADQLGAGAICISPSRLPLAPEVLAPAIGPSVVLKVIIHRIPPGWRRHPDRRLTHRGHPRRAAR
ncbi:MAG TPA: hypothetical protein VF482_15310 [Trebonia sp.]